MRYATKRSKRFKRRINYEQKAAKIKGFFSFKGKGTHVADGIVLEYALNKIGARATPLLKEVRFLNGSKRANWCEIFKGN